MQFEFKSLFFVDIILYSLVNSIYFFLYLLYYLFIILYMIFLKKFYIEIFYIEYIIFLQIENS